MVRVGVRTVRRRGGGRAGSKAGIYKYVHERLIRLWKESVRAFITEAIQHVKVDTGMSMASFLPLANAVSIGSMIKSEIGSRPAKAPRYDFDPASSRGTYLPGELRSADIGILDGNRAYTLGFGTQKSPKLYFSFEIVVWQHYLHETGQARHGGAWDSLEKGQRAFLDYFESNYERVIDSNLLMRLLEEYIDG